MDRHVTQSSRDKFIPKKIYPNHVFSLNEDFNQYLSVGIHNSIDKNFSPMHSLGRHISMPSYNQFYEEEQPLRIHVGNIPFLWTIDDLRKQFLVFGPVKDPEIVSNERGSKGFGFITFLRHSDGMNAIRVKNGSIADGRKITVALASSRSSSKMNSHHCCCCCYCKNSM